MIGIRDVMEMLDERYASIAGSNAGGLLIASRYCLIGDSYRDDPIRDIIHMAIEQKFGSEAFADLPDGKRVVDLTYFRDPTKFSELGKLETAVDCYKIKEIKHSVVFLLHMCGGSGYVVNLRKNVFNGIPAIEFQSDDITTLNTLHKIIKTQFGDAVVKIGSQSPSTEPPTDNNMDSLAGFVEELTGRRHHLALDAQFFSDEANLKALRTLPATQRELFPSRRR